jgi:uncharacterized membrane protein
MNKTLIAAALAGILTAGAASAMDMAAPKDKEKCYGITKAGKNDCSSAKKGGHACAGHAEKDNDGNEWKFVAKGECEKMKGSLTPAG